MNTCVCVRSIASSSVCFIEDGGRWSVEDTKVETDGVMFVVGDSFDEVGEVGGICGGEDLDGQFRSGLHLESLEDVASGIVDDRDWGEAAVYFIEGVCTASFAHHEKALLLEDEDTNCVVADAADSEENGKAKR